MVNFGLNSASILGIFLAVAGAALYFMRSVRPELSRDQDIFFAAVGLLCGFILLFQGWRLDPILQFGQFLLTGTTIFFAYEAIRLRGVATKVVKERTPIVDDERPVSKAYRYDPDTEYYDQLEPEEERYVKRRLRGTETEDSYSTRTEEARRLKTRTGSEKQGSGEKSRSRRPRPTGRPSEPPVERWDAEIDSRESSDWEDPSSRSSRPRPSTRPESRDSETASRPRKRRPSQDRGSTSSSREVEPSSRGEYVDYQPIDSSEEEGDNSGSGRFDY
ncbi:Ycf66 family protein [Allocoleopsis sp.]|uniref:Ycf66 family protein n=1 Tax=Allocoleopsis sp. TaxID=3088169 RepID=UPI002FD6C4EB